MSASWFLARLELSRHRLRWTVIALAIVVGSTVVIAATAGARRTSTVYERFRAHNKVANTAVLIEGLSPAQLAAVRALPQIESSAVDWRVPGRVRVGNERGSEEIILTGGPRVGLDVNRFTFLAGRAPVAADEIVVDSLTAKQTGFEPGSRVQFSPYDTSKVVQGRTPPTLAPEILRVTGVVATPDELGRLPGTLAGFSAPAYRGGKPVGAVAQILEVRLENEPRVFDRFQSALAALRRQDPSLPEGVAAVGDSGDTERRVQTALDALAITLLVMAAAVFLEGLVLLATALSRIYELRSDDSDRLAAVGATRVQRVRGLALPAAIVGVPAVVLGAVAAWFLSSRFPMSSARQLETMPGRQVDWLVTLGAGALLVVTVLATTTVVALRAAVRDGSEGRAPLVARARVPRGFRSARRPRPGRGSPSTVGAR